MSHPSQPVKAMEVTGRQPLDFTGCSDSTSEHHQPPPHYSPTTAEDCHWNSSSDDYHNYFPNLIESVLYDGGASTLLDPSHSFITFQTPCTSSSSDTMCNNDDDNTPSDKDLKGLRLVHLLVAAAEALNGPIRSRELARVILLRLKDLVSANCGTNIERLAAHFTDALQGLLNGSAALCSGGTDNYRFRFHQIEVLAAFHILQDVSPYIKFGHFTANQAILEAVAGDRRIHIVDYDITEGIQWASLMQALVSREEGTPPPHLRITALSRRGGNRRSLATVQETGRHLVVFAESIGQPFSFHQHRLDSDERFEPDGLKLYRGEALVINCMLLASHSGYRGSESVASFLSGSRSLNPRLVTLAEEESVCIQGGGFIGRFIDLLHRYSTLYDSLEAGFPMNGWARGLVERVFLGPRILGSVAGIYRTQGWWLWREWLSAVGYREVRVSFANHCQAKLLLGLFNGRYRVEELAVNALVLGWKSRNMVSASVCRGGAKILYEWVQVESNYQTFE